MIHAQPRRNTLMRYVAYVLAAFTAAFLALATVASSQTVGEKVGQEVEKGKLATKDATEKAKTTTKDAWVASKTKIALYADERVSGNAINVDANAGVVTLRGKVGSPEEKKTAQEVAKGIEGVTQVKNNLEVVPSAEKAVNRKDDEITKAVKERLAKDPQLKGSDVEVRSDNGVVTLTGDAKNLDTRARASQLARGVAGVKAVKNELKEKS
jgi:hyperosmotically inducible periplasmic protein